MIRPDDPQAVMEHAGFCLDGKALIVLGGPSGAEWRSVRDQVNPDVILTANGNTDLPGAEYWMLSENMNFQYKRAQMGDERGRAFIRMLNAPNTAAYRLISHRSWNLIEDKDGCIRIRRYGRELSQFDDFSFREYGQGYLWGWLMRHKAALNQGVNTHVGTVAAQLLHHAGILGCAEVHTIGMDLMFRGEQHHWYVHPHYQPDRFSTEHMFIKRQYGDTFVFTRWDMVEAAQFFKAIEYLFERDGLYWVDHSRGLLSFEGLRCATGHNSMIEL